MWAGRLGRRSLPTRFSRRWRNERTLRLDSSSCTLDRVKAMKSKYPIGILGATGMVGQRYIQLLADHPWFEIAWLAASDRSSGKAYGEAAKWRLDTPLPERIAKMPVSPADPAGAPRIIFASVDAAFARELEPKFAEAGCAVLS